jgi:hypothetical protein
MPSLQVCQTKEKYKFGNYHVHLYLVSYLFLILLLAKSCYSQGGLQNLSFEMCQVLATKLVIYISYIFREIRKN